MKRFLTLLLSGLLLFLAGCGNPSTPEGQGIQFYYSVGADTDSGPAIAAETEQLEQVSVETVMQRLLQGPTDPELSKTFPSGTTLQSWNVQEGTLALDLSEAFGGLSGMDLTQAEYCIVLTLSQLDEVERVNITVDGQALPGASGASMSVEDVILKGETEDPITLSSQLYFPLADSTGLGVEYREFEVPAMDLRSEANGVLEQMLQGPKEAEMTPFLNGAGALTAIEIREQQCIVELDAVTLSVLCSDEASFPLYLYAIVDSLTELDGIVSVSFVMDGTPIGGFEAAYTAVYEF